MTSRSSHSTPSPPFISQEVQESMSKALQNLTPEEQIQVIDRLIDRMTESRVLTADDIEAGNYTLVRVITPNPTQVREFLVSSTLSASIIILARKYVESRGWTIVPWDNGELYLTYPGKCKSIARELFRWECYK